MLTVILKFKIHLKLLKAPSICEYCNIFRFLKINATEQHNTPPSSASSCNMCELDTHANEIFMKIYY
jgi:hypothetical protein